MPRPILREPAERGSIMVLAIFFILLLAVIGVAIVKITGRDRVAAAQAATRERAFACAEAGLQYGRRFYGRTYEASNGWNDYLNGTAAGYRYPQSTPLANLPKQVRGASDGSTYDPGTTVDGRPQFWVSIYDDDDERPSGQPDNPARDNNETVILRSECTAFYYLEQGEQRTAAMEAVLVHIQNASGYGNAQITTNAPDVLGQLGTQ
jgi:Tfp pilus assembly protein PilX